MIAWLLLALLGCAAGVDKCQSNSEMKYELAEESQIVGYHSVCSEFAERTCCSVNNLETIRKRTAKYFGAADNVSSRCKQMLLTLMCSTCDGDIVSPYSMQGTRRRTAICDGFCLQVYQACKNDYFITEGNRLRVCLTEDPVCSTLSRIVSEPRRACEYLGYSSEMTSASTFIKGQEKCWDGISSSVRLGKAKNKISPRRRKEEGDDEDSDGRKRLVVILAAIALATVGVIKFMKR